MGVSLMNRLLGRKSAVEAEVEDTEPEGPVEHRHAERTGTFRVVSVSYPSGYERRGVVVDMSQTGLRVRFSQRGELPDHVLLKIEGKAGVQKAQTVWQETYEAGFKLEA